MAQLWIPATRRRTAQWLVAALAFMSALPAIAANITVRIIDANGQPLAHATITADWDGAPRASGNGQSAVESQRHLEFHPHVMVIPIGTSVSFPNYDRTRHQVYSFSRAKTFNLKLYVGRPQRPIVFDKTGLVPIGCYIHDAMHAYILVTDKPRWAVSNSQGQATLDHLPDQPVRLSIWHPWMATENTRVTRTVRPGSSVIAIQLNVTPPPTRQNGMTSSLQAAFDKLSQ